MHFVIAGSISCSQFTYAVMVAQRLKENLPDFTYLKMPMKPEEYKRWLIRACQENHWYHTQSPVIWREIGLKKGRKEFIGDVNKFLDMCYDYYGIPQDILSAEQFNRDEIQWFTKRTESEYFDYVKADAKQRRDYRSRQVCITGASSQITEIIVMELLSMEIQRRENGLEIRLFDEPTKEKKLTSASVDAKCCPAPSGFGNCRVANTLKEALFDIDLVIVLDAFTRFSFSVLTMTAADEVVETSTNLCSSMTRCYNQPYDIFCLKFDRRGNLQSIIKDLRKPNETLVKWLKRNRNAMCALGKALNKYAPAHCRVILGGPSTQPLCYNATVLASFATKLHVRNIVAVTQDLGRQMLKFLSQKAEVPLKDLYCPPVWGFVGLNKFVDLRKTLVTYLYKVPGKRAYSTLPQGREEYELRTCETLIDEETEGQLHTIVAGQRAEIFPQLGRWPCLAKATAILDLLRVWGIKREDGDGEILCLGVYSDGTFNIPRGIYWSQPVILVKGFWIPFPDYPIPRSPYFNFYYFFMFSVAALYRTKVRPRIYVPPKKKPKQKGKQKFNFNKIAEEVGMPVIRTDKECVSYLKYLTKIELGIDLDAVKDYIEEEQIEEVKVEVVPPEEVVEKQIYCECWRQELKELQKVVFEHSSTTEVEVDLSENVSGSEWSIINVPSKPNVPSGDDVNAGSEWEKAQKKTSEDTESVSTVCSCGLLPTGSVCKCLGSRGSRKEKESSEGDKISTEHFYKEQNAEIFEDDLKDVIYEDTFLAEKHAGFGSTAKVEDGPGPGLKFYGKEDAAQDAKAKLRMQKRILRYEESGELPLSSEEEEKSLPGEMSEMTISSEKYSKKSLVKKSFSDYTPGVEVEGEMCYGEIESLVLASPERKESSIVLQGENTASIQSYPHESEKSFRVSEVTFSVSGEDVGEGRKQKEASPEYAASESFKPEMSEAFGEKTADEASMHSTEDFSAMWGEESLYEQVEKISCVEEMQIPKKKKKKREGIPLCCLCRCLIPEGLSVCPCGESTVVEVFKKESIEVFIQNEDDIEYMIEYLEKKESYDKSPEITSTDMELEPLFVTRRREDGDDQDYDEYGEDDDYDEDMLIRKGPKGRGKPGDDALSGYGVMSKRKRRKLPPESFFPFHPRPENKFKETLRPFELTREFMEALEKKEIEVPPKCLEFFNLAKRELEERSMPGEDADEFDYEYSQRREDEEEESLPPICEEVEKIRTDFSDLKMFVPCGMEDWRVTVQKKYQEWYFQGPKIKDETYYDVAVEQLSDEEVEDDEELQKYFES